MRHDEEHREARTELQDALLHVHSVFGLVEDTDWGPENFRRNFSRPRCAGRQCMKTASAAASDMSSGVHLYGWNTALRTFSSDSKTHTGHESVYTAMAPLTASCGFVSTYDFGFRFAGDDTLPSADHFRRGRVLREEVAMRR